MPRYNGGFIGTDGLDAPDPPTDVTPTAGNEQVSVAFTAPTDTGTSAITGFVAQVSTDGTNYSAGSNTGSSSPIVVSSLTNGTAATAKVWAINAYGTSAPSEASASFTPVADRALFAGGYSDAVAGYKNIIDFINIGTLGNASDFGDLTNAPFHLGALANTTRGIFAGGELGADFSYARVNVIQYVTMGTEGNASDFGDLTAVNRAPAGSANDTRGLFSAGYTSSNVKLDVIQYITIASTGNATDFGDCTEAVRYPAAVSSTTRSVRGGGQEGASNNNSNVMDYVTIASTGNAQDFGDLTEARSGLAGCASSTRGLFMGGNGSGGNKNIIDYITIASTGNATDFGDLTAATQLAQAASSKLRGVYAGGLSETNVIEYVTIASTGNSQDFGDLTQSRYGLAVGNCSQGHGGLA